MKLVTFQSMEALKYLINNGYLICDEKFINKEKSEIIYNWIIEKMNNKIKKDTETSFPIWAWVKCYNGICPPKHRGEKIKGFDVKIVFNKKEEEVFITDYRKFSFLLNNIYIPDNMSDKKRFDKLLEDSNISNEDLKAYVRKDKYNFHRTDKSFLDVCSIIENSFDKCITTDSDILQGCVWNINIDEVESIEILPNDGYIYGSLNYKRANGTRIDWQKDLYKKLK